MTHDEDAPNPDHEGAVSQVRRFPIPVHRFRVHDLETGAVLFVFDLDVPSDPASASSPPLLDALTPGQRRVAELALRGLSDNEIAAHLDLSRHTVSNLLRRAYAKLGINSRVELCARIRGV